MLGSGTFSIPIYPESQKSSIFTEEPQIANVKKKKTPIKIGNLEEKRKDESLMRKQINKNKSAKIPKIINGIEKDE